jgi:outer membrane usher protein
MDTRVTYQDRSVRPPNRSGVNVDFGATRSRSAVVNVRLENGQPLPGGATLRLQDGSEDFLSAPGGDVYLDGLRERNVVVAHFEGSSCQFPLDLRGSDDPQPQLGQVTCRTAQQ